MELVLGSIIQSRWPSNGPMDSIYGSFADQWLIIRKDMKKVEDEAERKNMVAPLDDITRQLHARLLLLLSTLTVEKPNARGNSTSEAEVLAVEEPIQDGTG